MIRRAGRDPRTLLTVMLLLATLLSSYIQMLFYERPYPAATHIIAEPRPPGDAILLRFTRS